MRYLAVLLFLAAAFPSSAQTFDVEGLLTIRGVYASGRPSWLEGEFGRMDAGGTAPGSDATKTFGIAQLGFTWEPSQYVALHASGVARAEPSSFRGRRAGVVEAFADLRAFRGGNRLQLRAGQFFLPTSRENRDALWTSPYTITLSALNSWIAHEFRPIGAEVEWKHDRLTLAATGFRGNDTMGTLLAWRGFAVGNRLTVHGETVPLPPLFSLDRFFTSQRRDGTQPFGRDLDGRTGFAGRIRWQQPGRAMLQFAHIDNRGDRGLHHGEYAWRTRFHIVGAETGSPEGAILVAEYSWGDTGMGPLPVFVQADFLTGYLLASWRRGNGRLSARFDIFQMNDRDGSAAESNDERGRSWTIAWMHDFGAHLRGAAEFVQVTGRRLAAEQSGFSGDTDGRTMTVELRYRF
ncbi:MAG TPA: hypothetical protein VNL91_07365 [Thermoanaerobaculia bacterium]|nr:hypothetical protein [Thermoanaerobaculia bacterium]